MDINAGRTSRRRLLGAMAAACCATLAAPGELWAGPKKLQKIEQGARGTTLTFKLKRAPFPVKGGKYKDSTVIVFVPKYYRLPRNRHVDALFHFHGHHTTARKALGQNQLREQLDDSKQNAILVVPQGPVNVADSAAGKLEHSGGLQRLVAELCRELRRSKVCKALGKSSLAGLRGIGVLCISAHSGGYHAAACCLRLGGRNVHEVYLFDSLYGHVNSFRKWVLAKKGHHGRGRHKLISQYVGGKVRDNNLKLLADLKKAGVKVYVENKPGQLTRAQLTKGTAIFINTPVGHGASAHRHNNLRDCLYASCMKRFVKSDWFSKKNDPRRIDGRGG